MRVHATAFFALLAALATNLASGGNCPGISTTTHLRKTVLGGKRAWLTVHVKNTGTTALDDLAVALTLPDGVSFVTGKTLPKNGDIDLDMDGEDLVQHALGNRKSRVFKVKVQYDKCAAEDSVIDVDVSQLAEGGTATFTTTTSAEVHGFWIWVIWVACACAPALRTHQIVLSCLTALHAWFLASYHHHPSYRPRSGAPRMLATVCAARPRIQWQSRGVRLHHP